MGSMYRIWLQYKNIKFTTRDLKLGKIPVRLVAIITKQIHDFYVLFWEYINGMIFRFKIITIQN